jgi:aryl-alcohol dehydrogenase-like predicted oxidoreductase
MAHCIRCSRFDVVLTAFNFSALFREAAHEVIPAAKERNMGIVLGSVLQQGGLARRYDTVVRDKPAWLAQARQGQLLALYQLLDDCGMSIIELGLRFAIGNRDAGSILIGPKTGPQVADSVAAVAKGPLPRDVAARLDEIAALVPYRPFEEPMILPFGNPRGYWGPGMANVGAGAKVGKLP